MPTLAVDDIALHYTDNERDAPPLVFVHGLGSSGRDWFAQTEAFNADYRVLTCDLRGHGQTSKPAGPYSIAQMARDVAVWIRKLALPPVHLVGLSMGGMVTYELLTHAPELLRSGTVVNSVPAVNLQTPADYAFYWSRRGAVQVLGMRRVGQILAHNLFIKPHQNDLRKQFIERWAANDQQAYLASIDGLVGWGVESRLSQIRRPVLVCAADNDYTPASVKKRHAARIPEGQLMVIADARHALPVERPDAFNAALRAFLKRVDARGPAVASR